MDVTVGNWAAPGNVETKLNHFKPIWSQNSNLRAGCPSSPTSTAQHGHDGALYTARHCGSSHALVSLWKIRRKGGMSSPIARADCAPRTARPAALHSLSPTRRPACSAALPDVTFTT